jgi:hypothetical protein
MNPVQLANGTQKLTRSQAITLLQEYHARYGEINAACLNPSSAKWTNRPDLVERYYAGRENGEPWPSLNSVKRLFDGSWTAAMIEAGFEPNKSGPDRRYGGAPIRDVRVQRVFVEKTADSPQIARLEGKLDRATARAERAERLLAEVKADRKPKVKTVVREKVITKTVTKPVKVREDDPRLSARLADARAALAAAQDQTSAAVRDRLAVRRDLESMARDLTAALSDVRDANERVNTLEDQLNVSERLITSRNAALEIASGKLDERSRDFSRVSEAEKRAQEAEMRAARAERQMVEQAAAITGERRRLTSTEVAELRAKGPTGEAVVAKALGSLAKARRHHNRTETIAALTEVASAALTWRDTLR